MAPSLPRWRLLLALLAGVGCGRTQPVHYSTDAGNLDINGIARLDDGGVACIDGTSPLLHARPVVMLVLDRSGSMSQTFPGTRSSKWAALRDGLHQALPPWGGLLELGVLFFPANSTGVSKVCPASRERR